MTRRIRRQPVAPAGNATNMCYNSKIPCDERRFSLCVRAGGGDGGEFGLKRCFVLCVE